MCSVTTIGHTVLPYASSRLCGYVFLLTYNVNPGFFSFLSTSSAYLTCAQVTFSNYFIYFIVNCWKRRFLFFLVKTTSGRITTITELCWMFMRQDNCTPLLTSTSVCFLAIIILATAYERSTINTCIALSAITWSQST